MNTMLTRAGVALVCAATITGTTVSTASAAPGDAVTGGTTTFTVPRAVVAGSAGSGVAVTPIKAATASYDRTAKTATYTFPVSGGDGSVNVGYGSVVHSGGFRVADAKTHRSVTFTALRFSAEDLVLSATPTGGSAAVDLGSVGGSTTASYDKPSGRQEFTGTDVQLSSSGAAYLDAALRTTVFAAGQHLGSFDTVFFNTQY